MSTHPRPLEPEDVLDLPLPDGVSGYELVNGAPVAVSPASFQHGWLLIEIGRRLAGHIESHGIAGEVAADAGFVLNLPQDRTRMRGPDIMYVSHSRIQQHGDPGPRFARFIPELAIEVDVTSGRKPGGKQRIREYLAAGVSLVWALEPRTRSATVYRSDGSTQKLSEQDALDGEDVVPGFILPLGPLYRRAPGLTAR